MISSEEYAAAAERMRVEPSGELIGEHPFSHALRALARSMGIKHVVWSFAKEEQSPEGACVIVAGTTTDRPESIVLAITACRIADTKHESMRAKWLSGEGEL